MRDPSTSSADLPGVDGKRLLITVIVGSIASGAYYTLIVHDGLRWQAWFAVHPELGFILMVVAAIVVAWLFGRMARAFLGDRLVFVSAAAGGAVATAMFNGLVGVIVGAVVGLLMVSDRLRRGTLRMLCASSSALGISLPLAMFGGFFAFLLSQDGSLLRSSLSKTVLAASVTVAIILPFGIAWLRRNSTRRVTDGPGRQLVWYGMTYVLFAAIGVRAGIEAGVMWQVAALRDVGFVATYRPAVAFLDIAIGRNRWQDATSVVLGSQATDEDLARLRYFPSLDSLSLEECNVTAAGIQAVGPLDDLRHVWFRNVPIDDAALKSLMQNATPSVLWIANTQVSDRSLPLIGGWPLRSLKIERLQRTGRSLKPLSKCTTLTWLVLKDSKIQDSDLFVLTPLPGIRHLGVAGNEVTGPGLSAVVNWRFMGSLELSDNPLDDRFLATVIPMPIAWLDLDGIALTDCGWRAIAELSNLNHLSVTRTGDDSRRLSNIVPRLSKLKEIRIDGTSLSPRVYELPVDTVAIHVSDERLDAADINRFASMAYTIEQSRYSVDVEVILDNCQLPIDALSEIQQHPFRLFTLTDCDLDERGRGRLGVLYR